VIDARIGEQLQSSIEADARTMKEHLKALATERVKLVALLQRWLGVAGYVAYDGKLAEETKKELGL
jgi:hypothetical protein